MKSGRKSDCAEHLRASEATGSSLNSLLSGFVITMNLLLHYLEGVMRTASFSKLTLVNLWFCTEQVFSRALANKRVTFQ